MKIAMVSKADAFGGGASRVAEELTSLANDAGYTVHHYCSWTGKGYTEQRRGLYGRFEKEIRALHYLVKKSGFPEYIPFELPFLLRRLKEHRYDLIHFHDLSSAISPWTLIYLSKKLPIVWTMHDCSPFTGGCLYPMECDKYKTSCKNCPQIGTWPIDAKLDFVFMNRKLKEKLHQQKNISLITPSQWMADKAYSSGMLTRIPKVISNGVNTDVFQALDKNKLKKEMNIPLDRPVVLVSAGNILDERKGTKYALEALRRIKELQPFLIVVGSMDDHAKEMFSEFDYYKAGYLSEDSALNRHYAVSDLFLFCSLADNQPLVILETMASGTPTIGFQTGGIPEMIEENKTGFLVKPGDVEALVQVLKKVIKEKTYIKWGENARLRAENYYSYDVFLNNHLHHYEKTIENFLKVHQYEF